tara:strand:- start:5470 stop:6210 length:741 start_codon:yes stop_codon:yes gene_type:complete
MPNEINVDLNKRRLKLNKRQTLGHYYIVSIPILILVFFYISTKVINLYSLIPLVLSIVFYLIQRKNLKFRELKVNCSQDDLIQALDRSSKSLDWRIESTNQVIYAFDWERWEWRYHTGYLIIIVKSSHGFIFNTIPDPRKFAVPFFKPYSGLNLNVFIKHLKDVLNNNEYNEDFKSQSNEWSLKNILIRLFLYPLILVVFSLTISTIFFDNNFTLKGIFSLLITSIISVIYLYHDITAILRDRTNK